MFCVRYTGALHDAQAPSKISDSSANRSYFPKSEYFRLHVHVANYMSSNLSLFFLDRKSSII